MKCKIIFANEISRMEEEINEYLSAGWKLHGQISGDSSCAFQAMVKEDENQPDKLKNHQFLEGCSYAMDNNSNYLLKKGWKLRGNVQHVIKEGKEYFYQELEEEECQTKPSPTSNTTCGPEKAEKIGCANDFYDEIIVRLIKQISTYNLTPENYTNSIESLRQYFCDDIGMNLKIGFGYFIDLLKAVYLTGKEDGKSV